MSQCWIKFRSLITHAIVHVQLQSNRYFEYFDTSSSNIYNLDRHDCNLETGILISSYSTDVSYQRLIRSICWKSDQESEHSELRCRIPPFLHTNIDLTPILSNVSKLRNLAWRFMMDFLLFISHFDHFTRW